MNYFFKGICEDEKCELIHDYPSNACEKILLYGICKNKKCKHKHPSQNTCIQYFYEKKCGLSHCSLKHK